MTVPDSYSLPNINEIFDTQVVTNKDLKPMDSKVNDVKSWIKPCNIIELRFFLGTVGYYKKFITNFSMIATSFK